MMWPRASGILLHPTSLPGPYGIGDLGPSAMRLLDDLAASGQKIWQVLPLGPTGLGNSPYAMVSAFAGNPMLISPDVLVEQGLLRADECAAHSSFPADHVDYAAVVPFKLSLLRRAYERFLHGGADDPAYQRFREEHAHWLDDYATYLAIKARRGGASWERWPRELAQRDPAALAEISAQLADEISFHMFLQYEFFRQWDTVHEAARQRGISILGDLAIFVAHDSADVWAHRDLFQLDEMGNPTVVAGVPPDYFSETGQRWGNPLYRWDAMRADGYAWWIARVRQALTVADMIRLDHFRGFESYWEVPAEEETAINGRWVAGPGEALFAAIKEALGEAPFIAEDLGLITPEVHELRHRLGFPSMNVLQFAFGSDAANPHLPHNYHQNAVVYTGTHDNDTTRGWFATIRPEEQARVLRYLNCDPERVVWEMIRAAEASVARTCIIPMQDALNLGSEARMNVPARPEDNWEWRMLEGQMTSEIAARLAELAEVYGR